jgi:hypothetical protein
VCILLHLQHSISRAAVESPPMARDRVHLVNTAVVDEPASVAEVQYPSADDGSADLILESTDKALATFSAKRNLLLD